MSHEIDLLAHLIPEKKCRKCGKMIDVITWGVYRKAIVDAEAVEVVADPEGEDFIRIDGSKVRAREAETGVIQAGTEWAYRPHKKSCGVSG